MIKSESLLFVCLCESFRGKILEYRSESQRLDQCSRLYDSSVSTEGFEFDASRIVQVLMIPSLYSYWLISVLC